MLVAHAASLDTCTRQIVGESARSAKEMMAIVSKVPFCSVASIVEESDSGKDRKGVGGKSKVKVAKKWKLADTKIPAMTHLANHRFDWKILLN